MLKKILFQVQSPTSTATSATSIHFQDTPCVSPSRLLARAHLHPAQSSDAGSSSAAALAVPKFRAGPQQVSAFPPPACALSSHFPAWQAPKRKRRHISPSLPQELNAWSRRIKPDFLCGSAVVTKNPSHPALELPAQTKPNPTTNSLQPLRGVVSPHTKMTEVWAQNFPPPGL